MKLIVIQVVQAILRNYNQMKLRLYNLKESPHMIADGPVKI